MGWGALEKKPHLIKLPIVCLNRKKRGLCVRHLSVLNRVLLCKWIWHFSTECDSLWRKVIDLKFGVVIGEWCLVKLGVAMGLERNLEVKGDCSLHAAYFVRVGWRVSSWRDKGYGEWL